MERIKYIIQALWIAFSIPAIILGILILIRHFFKKMMRKNMFLIKVYKIVKIFLCIGFIVFIALEAAIISYQKNNEKKDDYIIVLGAGLDNGKTPNLILSERLDAAIKCEVENPNQYIVLSGGQGADECISEAEAMSQYLQERGIDKEKMIIEDKSRDTDENLKFSKEKIEEHSHKLIADVNVKIVTTDFHAFRSSILAKKNGYVNFDNYSSSTIWYFVPSTYIREAFAVVKSAIFDK
ncbi:MULTISPECIES: YdcF family protein [unclassified Clostridium]|uniref:YdcF family protein n=1 Tax=unclassified Clostridium TaxID=2614128 RepID=UPI0002986E1D|nr:MULTISPECIES: YdcF family protein [unclassified Clostridium]EKQ57647.1 MAG: hypothetical protein A370_00779 [Clostridium sp. Maddingley MBC34-26]